MNEQIKRKNGNGIWIAIIAVLTVILIVVIGIAISKNGSEQRYRKQIKLAERYLDELDYDKAIAYYRAAIEIDPENPEAYKALAELYIEMDEEEKAVKILKSGIKKTTDDELEKLLSKMEDSSIDTTVVTTEDNNPDETDHITDPDGDNGDPGDTVTEALDNDNENSELIAQSISAYEAFMNDTESCYDPKDDKEYYIEEAVQKSKSFARTFYTGNNTAEENIRIKVSYAYIDCGMDGIPELILSYNYVSERGPESLHDEIIKYSDGRLIKCDSVNDLGVDYWERSDRYGIITEESYWGRRSVRAIDENGNRVELYTDDPLEDYSYDENLKMCFTDDDMFYYCVVRRGDIYYGSMNGSTFYSYDPQEAENQNATSNIESVLRRAAVETCSYDEYRRRIDSVIYEYYPDYVYEEPEWVELGIF